MLLRSKHIPYPNEHSCRIHDPASYVRLRRQNAIGEVDGKRLDAILGIKDDGSSEVQSFRYPLDEGWTTEDAHIHCKSHSGAFEAAASIKSILPGPSMSSLLELDAVANAADREALAAYAKGDISTPPVIYKTFGHTSKDDNTDLSTMVFVASESTPDRIGDIIHASGWQLDSFTKNPVLMFGHDHGIPPIGKVVKVWIEGDKLLDMVQFDAQDPFAALIAGKYQRGFMSAQSVGFRPLEFHRNEASEGGYEFTKQELVEISMVAVPMHPMAVRKVLGERSFHMVVPEIINVPHTTVTSSSITSIAHTGEAPIAEALETQLSSILRKFRTEAQ